MRWLCVTLPQYPCQGMLMRRTRPLTLKDLSRSPEWLPITWIRWLSETTILWQRPRTPIWNTDQLELESRDLPMCLPCLRWTMTQIKPISLISRFLRLFIMELVWSPWSWANYTGIMKPSKEAQPVKAYYSLTCGMSSQRTTTGTSLRRILRNSEWETLC